MNTDHLKQLFPKASNAFLALNSLPEAPPMPKRRTLSAITQQDHANTKPATKPSHSPVHPRKASKLECNLGNGALAKSKAKGKHPSRVLVRVTSYRTRLIDEDNLCEKYHVDCCRYSGLLYGDSAAEAKIEVCQEKVGSKAAETTLIEIIPLPNTKSSQPGQQ